MLVKKGYGYIAVAVIMFTSYEVVLKYIAGQINSVQLTSSFQRYLNVTIADKPRLILPNNKKSKFFSETSLVPSNYRP